MREDLIEGVELLERHGDRRKDVDVQQRSRFCASNSLQIQPTAFKVAPYRSRALLECFSQGDARETGASPLPQEDM